LRDSLLKKDRRLALQSGTFFACIVLTLAAFRGFLASATSLLDYETLKQNGFYLWAVLALCLLWIYLKRREIIEATHSARDSKWLIFGSVLVGTSLGLLYFVSAHLNSLPLMMFAVSFVVVAQFSLFFGHASKIPLMLLGLFGIAVGFPILLESTLGTWFSRATAVLSVSTLQFFSVPVSLDGVTVTLNSLLGYEIVTKVDARCAGSDSLAIFLAIFGLMLIDRRPSNKALVGLLVLGVVGTYLQNFSRLLLLFAAGRYYGAGALWAVHDYASYLLFPLWFAAFVVIYLKYADKSERAGIGRRTSAESRLEF
jgi:exosortase/archaeosortase family protein